MAADTNSASEESASEKPKRDDSCQQVLSEYFDLTRDTLEKQVELCRKISEKIAEGKYTPEEAQEIWQEGVDRATDYSRRVTELWVESMTRCSFSPDLSSFAGWGNAWGDFLGGSSSNDES